MINQFAHWWLIEGNKYKYSKWRAGPSWGIHAETALRAHGLELKNCSTMHDVINLLLGKFFWYPDGLFQLDDYVKSPIEFASYGGDDCDGGGMFHAQCMEFVLKPQGWKSQIVSYLAEDFRLSHHYCALTEPSGKVWVVQPQPTKEYWNKHLSDKSKYPVQVIFGPYSSIEETVPIVASWYNTKPVMFDIRNSMYEK